jgi:hypothetical protein
MRKTRNAVLGILTVMSEQFWPCRLRRQNDIFLASTKGCQSDFSVIPMGAPISRGRHSAIPTSTPTTGVTTPLDTTTGITILVTTGNTAVTASSSCGSGRSPDWLKMKNSDAPAVNREAEEDWGHVPRKNQTFLQHESSPGQSITPL